MTGARVFGGVLLALGVVAFVATLGVGDGWQASGPRLAPAVSAAALVVLALAFLVRPGEKLAAHVTEAGERTHWPTPALLVALLVGYALALDLLGYALATAIFYWLATWLLGSRSPVRDVAIAVALGVVTSFVFSEWLNVQLPTGPWGL
ncbi:tripartite tricarboxylate transporter TctB family protein [Solirubrobacter sp. CPCC 204708]|uniref:Tripartite tricarboxylate transporter TctB family protein n=1 Tax=Solirubrobacter deserti TaxID=2282478 RepID=A0ABT4RLY4_9ACTN|nr:tripartite tricarboxylate transporter TctB family protein [Solirubrobacter deserti]MBE2314433.1 tripartite tricarboxylate transporter TctB family protein [Solirubrobacter deserti]MDA0139579.1 tripartite tricarboxylate transporter TctB family protein [Solirubrobacter deserti]